MKNSSKQVAFVIAFLLFQGCTLIANAQSPTSKDSVPQKESSYYTCSMHPEIHSATPGTCPKCGMQLVKVDSNGGQKKPHHMMMGCGMMGGMGSMNKSNTEQQSSNSKESAKKYTCSMHSDVLSDKPGKCPKCGMDLIELK